MKRRPVGFEQITTTARAIRLAPQATAGMPIGTDIVQSHPALIRTVQMRAEMLRGVHLARPSSRGSHAGWRATGRLGSVLVGLLTGGTGGLADETLKRLRAPGALAPWRHRRVGPPMPRGS